MPGCRNRRFLDVHHLTRRVDGGTSEPDGLLLTCGAHHRAIHRGLLWVEGSPSTGLTFRHADGTRYGNPPTPAVVEAMRDAFSALRNLGYREKDCHRMLDRARAHVGSDADVPALVRAALQA